jgi:hypothetical protein
VTIEIGSMQRSPLELFHPDGYASRSVVLGSGCPLTLVGEEAAGPEPADLVILAPDAREGRRSGWLENASREATAKLARDGLLYIVAPPLARAKLRRLIVKRGLLAGPAVAHLPDLGTSRFLVPLDRASVRHALSRADPVKAWHRRLAAAGSVAPVLGLAAAVRSQNGLITRRAGARPLLDWLARLSGDLDGSQRAVVGTSWRGTEGSVVLYRKPRTVAKTGLTSRSADAAAREAEMLRRLGPSAARAGAHVPSVVALGSVDGRPVVVETAVEGRSAAALLTARPGRLGDVLDRVTTWLERWSRLTRVTQPIDAAQLQTDVLAPAALLGLDDGYRRWLEHRCEALAGRPAPLVDTHNDLTMWNVLLDDRGGLGIIDWETARQRSMPLGDFFYALVDAVSAADSYRNRLHAFAECFSPGGAHAARARALERRLQNAVEASEEIAQLSLHACWLQHAANERHAAAPGEARPFLEIVRMLAARSTR